MNLRKGLTLQELLIVVVVVGILASIALVQYNKSVFIARAREAKANLRLIQTAQKIYYTQTRSYLSSFNITEINNRLGLNLAAGGFWEYATFGGPSTVGAAFYPSMSFTEIVYIITTSGDPICDTPATCPE